MGLFLKVFALLHLFLEKISFFVLVQEVITVIAKMALREIIAKPIGTSVGRILATMMELVLIWLQILIVLVQQDFEVNHSFTLIITPEVKWYKSQIEQISARYYKQFIFGPFYICFDLAE